MKPPIQYPRSLCDPFWARPLWVRVSLFRFGRLAIKMGFVIAYDRNQPCN
jgi:hypothetical protein